MRDTLEVRAINAAHAAMLDETELRDDFDAARTIALAVLAESRVVELEAQVAELEQAAADRGACLGVMREAMQVYERGGGGVPERMAQLLLTMLDVLGPVHSAYPPSVERAILRFGIDAAEGRSERGVS